MNFDLDNTNQVCYQFQDIQKGEQVIQMNQNLFFDEKFWNQSPNLNNHHSEIQLLSYENLFPQGSNEPLSYQLNKNIFTKVNDAMNLQKSQLQQKFIYQKKFNQQSKNQFIQFQSNCIHQNQLTSKQSHNSERKRYTPQTKNIVKNYGRSILAFGLKNKVMTQKLAQKFEICPIKLVKEMKKHKKKIGSIAHLRSLWLDSENPHAKYYRIITFMFLRKHSLHYIFNSNIKNLSFNVKYGKRILEGVRDPQNFVNLKDF